VSRQSHSGQPYYPNPCVRSFVRSKKPILGLFCCKNSTYIHVCCLFAHNSLSSRLPLGRACNLLPQHLPGRCGNHAHQGGGKPVLIKMTLFGLYLICYQPYLSIFESFWFHKESKIWNGVCDLKRIAEPKSS
jgi:hypothetical protein